MAMEAILDRVGSYGCPLVEVTGGGTVASAGSSDIVNEVV